jgi:hypothetical protein
MINMINNVYGFIVTDNEHIIHFMILQKISIIIGKKNTPVQNHSSSIIAIIESRE